MPNQIFLAAHTFALAVTVSMSWTSPVLPKLSEKKDNPLDVPITSEDGDLIGSLLYIGAAIGPILFIPAAEYFGRKKVLLFLSFIPPLAYGTYLFARVVEFYFVFRILQGIFMGGSFSLVPVYLSEILSDADREFYMSFMSLFGFSGLMIVYAIGPFLPLVYFNSFLLVFSSVVVVLFGFGCPETPFYVMKTEGKEATKELLMILRKDFNNKEADEIECTVNNEVKDSFLELFRSIRNLKIFIIATIPLILQTFSGISTVVTYSELIFEKTNVSIDPAICSLIVACFQVSTSFLTPILLRSGKFSLKILLLICVIGLAFCNFVLSSYFFFFKDTPSMKWLPLLALILFVPFYNSGIDPIPWMFMGQAYPKNISSVGSALSTSIYFLSNFPSLFLFSKIPIGYLFLSSACFCCFGILYVFFIFSEPKNV